MRLHGNEATPPAALDFRGDHVTYVYEVLCDECKQKSHPAGQLEGHQPTALKPMHEFKELKAGVLLLFLLQNNMNQRAIRLVVTSNADGVATLRMPPNQYIAPPGWYMLFLMDGDVPCLQASWVQLRL
jgi:hypothetical protein